MKIPTTGTGKRVDPVPDIGFRRALALGSAYGVVIGIAEVSLLLTAKVVLGRFTHLNPQLIWMAPLFHATLFACIAMLLAGVRTRWRGLSLYRSLFLVSTFFGATAVLFLFTRLHKAAAMLLALGIAVQVMLLAVRGRGWLERHAYRLAAVLAVFPLLAFLGLNGASMVRERTGLAAAPANPDGLRNVVLIIWDTVRAANSSVYGYERETTPNLERLAAAGVTFERAYSTAPWTLPAHSSIFTGRWSGELGADWEVPLGDGPPTIAAVLRDGGYRTGGFVANRFYVSRESGLDRGFLRYDVYPVFSVIEFLTSSSLGRAIFNSGDWRRRLGMEQKPGRKYGEQVTSEFLDWLDGSDADRPFFAFLNYFDAHHPYLPPAPFDTMFGPLLPGRDPSMQEDRSFTSRELQAEMDAYDGGIAYDDEELGRLIRALEQRGLLENTLIIVTSDHGEEFGEHEVFTHGNSLYDPALHVPLVLGGPGIPEGRRITEWVSTRDIASTIADAAGAAVVSRPAGSSLARFWSGRAASAPDTLLMSVSYSSGHPERYPVSSGDLDAVIAAPYKYIREGDGSEELYDLIADPEEQLDLSRTPAHGPLLARLRTHWKRLNGGSGAEGTGN